MLKLSADDFTGHRLGLMPLHVSWVELCRHDKHRRCQHRDNAAGEQARLAGLRWAPHRDASGCRLVFAIIG